MCRTAIAILPGCAVLGTIGWIIANWLVGGLLWFSGRYTVPFLQNAAIPGGREFFDGTWLIESCTAAHAAARQGGDLLRLSKRFHCSRTFPLPCFSASLS